MPGKMDAKNIMMITAAGLFLLVAGILIGNYVAKKKDETRQEKEASIAQGQQGRESKNRKESGRSSNPDKKNAPKIDLKKGTKNLIEVSAPKKGAQVKSPIVITGKARGGWYFEATFPVKLLDEKGKVIAQGYAEAQGEWMTEDYVPFKASLPFSVTKKINAFLVLERNNASGLPEHDASIRIPLTLLPGGTDGAMQVKAYFGNSKSNPKADCEKVYPVIRSIAKTQSTARAAINELLKGPTAAEKAQGYYTSINSGVALNSLTISNGTAKADFSSAIEKNLGGSCRVTAIRAQIERTLLQFPTVKRVVISVAGKTEDVLQP